VEAVAAAAEASEQKAAEELDRFDDMLDERLERLRGRVQEAYVPSLEAVADAWAESLPKAVANVAAVGVAAAAANLEEVEQEALAQLEAACQPLVAEIGALGDRLTGALERLGAAIGQASSTVGSSAPALDGVRRAQDGLESATAALERMKALLASYSFTQA
jgi:hypothetical protein